MFTALFGIVILLFSSCEIMNDLLDWKFADAFDKMFGGKKSAQTQPNTQNTAQPQAVPVQAQPNLPTEKLTYYVNGNAKTANVIFIAYVEKAYSLDAGGNIVQHYRIKEPDDDWSDWEEEGIVQRRIAGIDNVYGVMGFIIASVDFLSATEETDGGDLYILVYQSYGKDYFNQEQFYKIDGNFVFTIQKVYVRQ